jgi:hypothetical protein
MAIFDLPMTMEEIMAPVELPPSGHYVMIYEGLLKDDQGNPYFPTFDQKGQQVRARFRIVSPDPVQNGRGLIYKGTLGQFTFTNLQKVVPLMAGGQLDDEAGVGTQIEVDLVRKTFKDDQGEEKAYLRWNKMRVSV